MNINSDSLLFHYFCGLSDLQMLLVKSAAFCPGDYNIVIYKFTAPYVAVTMFLYSWTILSIETLMERQEVARMPYTQHETT